MGTRVIDMSSCPCCCDDPDYLELTIDYGSSFTRDLGMYLPMDCNEVLGSYYTSSGTVVVQATKQNDAYYYYGQAGDLVEYVRYAGAIDANLLYIDMNYMPETPPFLPYTIGGNIAWPDGYCVMPNTVATPRIDIDHIRTSSNYDLCHFNFEMDDATYRTSEDACTCNYPYTLTGIPLDCTSDPRVDEGDFLGMSWYADAYVFIESGAVWLTEAAYNASNPCAPWDPVYNPITPDPDCPNGVYYSGYNTTLLRADLWSVVKVHVRAVRL